MASSGELIALLEKLADDSEETAEKIQGFSDDFENQSKEIQQALEGSHTSVGDDIAGIFNQAKKSLEETVTALNEAVQAARDYSQTL